VPSRNTAAAPNRCRRDVSDASMITVASDTAAITRFLIGKFDRNTVARSRKA